MNKTAKEEKTSTPKELLKEITGVEISSGYHLYNVEAKDLVQWFEEYARLRTEEKDKEISQLKAEISALRTSTGITATKTF